jgi:hypothetical protein
MVVVLFVKDGLWGVLRSRFGWRLFPVQRLAGPRPRPGA